jgi:transposase
MEKEKKLARERAAVILEVRSGKLTATEGAERLGVSRKTYYEWEDRALQAMAQALENHSPGRPPVPVDPEKEELQGKVQELEKKLYLAEKTIEVKDLLTAYDLHEAKKSKQNRGRRTGRGGKEGHGDHHRHQGENSNALRPHLQGHKNPVIDPGSVAEAEKGESPSSQPSRPQEGGAV